MKKILKFVMFLILGMCSYSMKLEDGMIVDSFGKKIVAKEYKKIVILDPAAVETIFMIGGEKNILAISRTLNTKIYPEEKTKELPSVGVSHNSSLEKIISLNPDLVITLGMGKNLSENLEKMNIPVLVTNNSSFDDILDNILVYGKITGREDEAQKLYKFSMEKLENIRRKIEINPLRIKGIILYSTSPMMAFGVGTLPGQILDILGIEDISKNTVGQRPIISPEFLLQENPDFIAGVMAIKSVEEIKNSSHIIKQTKAGENNNIFIIDTDKILRGSPRIIDEIENLYIQLKNI